MYGNGPVDEAEKGQLTLWRNNEVRIPNAHTGNRNLVVHL
jgi:hypothetical protein